MEEEGRMRRLTLKIWHSDRCIPPLVAEIKWGAVVGEGVQKRARLSAWQRLEG